MKALWKLGNQKQILIVILIESNRISSLLEDQLKEIQTEKVIMTLGVRWKKSAKLIITLYPDDMRMVLGYRQ